MDAVFALQAGQLLQMAAIVRSSGARPILLMLTPTYLSQHTHAPNSAIRRTNHVLRSEAGRAHLALINTYTALSGRQWLFSDGVHPNDLGYGLLAASVAVAIE